MAVTTRNNTDMLYRCMILGITVNCEFSKVPDENGEIMYIYLLDAKTFDSLHKMFIAKSCNAKVGYDFNMKSSNGCLTLTIERESYKSIIIQKIIGIHKENSCSIILKGDGYFPCDEYFMAWKL
jgi:hypothetical protein